jgi:7-cyano-7-deazaguanine synthase
MKLGIYDEIYHKMLDTNLSGKPSDYWIPNRNSLFINICAVIAEYRGFKYIVVGFNRDEAENFPDNTQEFLDAINDSLRYSTNNQVSVISPTCKLTKAEIVQIALDLDLPLNRIYSCYKGVSPMCGECPSCFLFKNALKKCGVLEKYREMFKR